VLQAGAAIVNVEPTQLPVTSPPQLAPPSDDVCNVTKEQVKQSIPVPAV